MLNDRRQRMLRLLLTSSGSLPAAEIGRLLGYSARSVRYDLHALSDWLTNHDARLVARTGVGYTLEGDRERVRAALNNLTTETADTYLYVPSPKERVRRLLLLLLSQPQHWHLQKLADRLGVGKTTVHADFADVELWCKHRGLELVRGASGAGLAGDEVFWRRSMVDLVLELADEGQLALLLEGHEAAAPLRILLTPLLPHVDWHELREVWSAAQTPEISIYLAVMINRLSDGNTLPYQPEQTERFHSAESWRVADSLCKTVEQACRLRIPSTEVAALTLLLETSRAGAGSPRLAGSEGDLALSRSLAVLLQGRLGIPLLQDEEFVTGLALHLRPMAHRIQTGKQLENPLLAEVQEKYPAVFRASEDVAQVLGARWHTHLPAAETGYLAIHIAAAIERDRLNRHPAPTALVVCGAGVGTAQLLVTRLRASLPEIRVGRVVSAFRMREALEREPHDLVISTCQVPPCGLPTVRVSPFLPEGDLARIRRALASRQADGSQQGALLLRDLLKPGLIQLDVPARNWEEAIRAAGRCLTAASLVEERYIEAMLSMSRELGPYIVLGPGFALPHARPEDGVRQPCISLVRLRTPVPFGHPGHDPVDLVFAIGAVDHQSHLTALMQLWNMLGREDALQRLRRATGEDEILQLVAEASTTSVDPIHQE